MAQSSPQRWYFLTTSYPDSKLDLAVLGFLLGHLGATTCCD